MTKQEFRALARKARESLPPAAREFAQQAVAKRLAALPELQVAQIVATYAASKGELDPNGFIAILDATPELVFPRVCGENLLTLCHCKPEELEPGTFGIPEPNKACPEVDISDVQLALLPGLAFDVQGNRLGYGKGYHDRLLEPLNCASLRPVLVGICYNETLFEYLPTKPHDVRVDIVITPTQTLQTSASRP